MKIPSNQAEKEQFVAYIIDCCMASSEDRRSLYERRRRYFLYGQNTNAKVKFNRLKSHMKLVASFLFSPDGLVYNVAPPRNALLQPLGQHAPAAAVAHDRKHWVLSPDSVDAPEIVKR